MQRLFTINKCATAALVRELLTAAPERAFVVVRSDGIAVYADEFSTNDKVVSRWASKSLVKS